MTLLEHNPDFMIYAWAINAWDDGTPLGEDEKADLLDQVVEEAAKLGARFEIQWQAVPAAAIGSPFL